MTQIHGVYCSYCRRRYAYHLCYEGLPCQHEYAELVRGGIGVKAPATTIECYAWHYKEGFQDFMLRKILFYVDDKGNKAKKFGETFREKYVDRETLKQRFLNFLLEKIQEHEWTAWVEAFIDTLFGGQSSTSIPNWRLKQLMKREVEG